MNRMQLRVGGVLLLLLAAAGAQVASAQEATYEATLSAAETVPAIESSANGTFTMTIDPATGIGTFHVSVPQIEDAIIGHVHLGAPGEAGPAVMLLFQFDPPRDTVDLEGAIVPEMFVGPHANDPQAFVAALEAGDLYVNVHTTANPAEEIRGQVVAATAPAPTEGAATPQPPAAGSAGLLADTGASTTSRWLVALGAVLTVGTLVGARRLPSLRRRRS